MAKVQGYNPPPELEGLIARSLMPNWTSDTLMMELSNRGLSRQKLAAIQGRSLLKVAGLIWRSLDPDFQQIYKDVGVYQKVNGWVVGLMQYCAASKLGFGAMYLPYMTAVGSAACILSIDDGEVIEFRQAHPLAYYVAQKVPGTKSRRMPQEVFEDYPSGVELKMSVSLGGEHDGYFVRWDNAQRGPAFRIRITIRHYRGQFRGSSFVDFREDVDYNAVLQQIHITGNPGISNYAGYDVIIQVRDFEGIMLFDSVELNHGGINYARDWRCKNPNARFIGHLAACLPNWEYTIRQVNSKIYGRGYRID